MRFERTTLDIDKFQDLYEQAFGKKNEFAIPSDVILGYDEDKYMGFVDIVKQTTNSCYLKYIGFGKDVPHSFGYFKEVVNYISSLGFQIIMGAIDNSRQTTLIWALRAGFKIIGVRIAGGCTFIEIMREEKNG
ncbi:hypothetical protein IMZ68_04730 [Candidatus Bathyarchaeota archaeon]|nr:hypothetical protein [Candidatus Bathyarchaeota archaeon]